MDDIEVVDADVDVLESDADADREGGGMAIASSSPRSRSRRHLGIEFRCHLRYKIIRHGFLVIRTRAKTHTLIKLIVLDSDTQAHPPSTASSTSENAVDSRPPPLLERDQDQGLKLASRSRCIHFLHILGGMRSSSSTETSALGCWAVFVPSPPPPWPSGGSSGRGDLWPWCS